MDVVIPVNVAAPAREIQSSMETERVLHRDRGKADLYRKFSAPGYWLVHLYANEGSISTQFY